MMFVTESFWSRLFPITDKDLTGRDSEIRASAQLVDQR